MTSDEQLGDAARQIHMRPLTVDLEAGRRKYPASDHRVNLVGPLSKLDVLPTKESVERACERHCKRRGTRSYRCVDHARKAECQRAVERRTQLDQDSTQRPIGVGVDIEE